MPSASMVEHRATAVGRAALALREEYQRMVNYSGLRCSDSGDLGAEGMSIEEQSVSERPTGGEDLTFREDSSHPDRKLADSLTDVGLSDGVIRHGEVQGREAFVWKTDGENMNECIYSRGDSPVGSKAAAERTWVSRPVTRTRRQTLVVEPTSQVRNEDSSVEVKPSPVEEGTPDTRVLRRKHTRVASNAKDNKDLSVASQSTEGGGVGCVTRAQRHSNVEMSLPASCGGSLAVASSAVGGEDVLPLKRTRRQLNDGMSPRLGSAGPRTGMQSGSTAAAQIPKKRITGQADQVEPRVTRGALRMQRAGQ